MSDDERLRELAQRCHLLLEILHVVVYFAAEPREAFAAYGLHGRAGYFASRAAAMGAVEPEVVTATFGVFAPEFVREKMAGTWQTVSPEQILAARHRAVAQTLHRVLGEPDVGEQLESAAAATTVLRPNGRPLYAAHARLPWPDDELMALWHAATLLREYRGDGHMAAMMLSGIDPLAAMILHGYATHTMGFLQQTRGWPPEQWQAARQQLHERGWLAQQDGSDVVTDAGREVKRELERQTRAAAIEPWRHLGAERSARLAELMLPIRDALMASDVFPPGSPLKPRDVAQSARRAGSAPAG